MTGRVRGAAAESRRGAERGMRARRGALQEGVQCITITGATGAVGGRVARTLGAEVGRLVVRDPARAPRIDGGPEVRTATYADGAAMRAALEGTDVLLLVSGAEAPDRLEQHRTAVRAAAEAGVQHVVYTSFDGAAADADFTLGRDHWHTEQAIRDSGMRWTFLRDSFYLDFFPLFADEHGVIRGPAGDGRVAAVARADVADVAAAVLRDPGANVDITHRLTGGEAISFPEAADRMTAALDRPFRFVDETLEQAYASRRPLSGEQWQLDAWVSTYTAIGSGELASTSDAVERITGHAPRTLEQALAG